MSDDAPHPTPQPPRRHLSDSNYRVLVGVALVGAVLALFVAIRGTDTGGEDAPAGVSSRPDVVEHLFPGNGDQVLRQSEIGIDLAPGHEGTLIVNGQVIPDDELRRVPEQNQIFYLPGEGTTFEQLPGGTNCVTAVVWESSVGRGNADQTYRWCFEAT